MRFGMVESPNCVNCGEVDTLQHRLLYCPRTLNLLNGIEMVTRPMRSINFDVTNLEIEQRIFAAYADVDLVTLMLHAEFIQAITSGRAEGDLTFINRTLRLIYRQSKDMQVKNVIRALLDD